MATGDISNFRSGNLFQGMPLGAVDATVQLATSSTNFVATQGVSLIHLYSTTTTAANALFTIQSGLVPVGGMPNQNNTLTLVFEAGTSFTCKLANSGNVTLVADWTPIIGQTLTLLWDSNLASWVEVARTPQALIGTALASGDIFVGNSSNVATAVVPSGAVTMTNAGVFSLATSIYQTASGSLTQANIQAMRATPVSLIAAPAAGSYIMIDEVELFYKFNTGAFTGGGNISIAYATAPTTIILWDATLLTGGGSVHTVVRPSAYNLDTSTGTSNGFVIQTAQAIVITNASGAFTAGNAASVLEWSIKYHTVVAQA